MDLCKVYYRNMKNNWKEEFIEKGSDLEHERWSSWQKYLHSLCVKNEDGTLTIPKERVKRWERQIATHYSELSEQEKEYDRIEVRKYLPMVKSFLAEQKKELTDKLDDMAWENDTGYKVEILINWEAAKESLKHHD